MVKRGVADAGPWRFVKVGAAVAAYTLPIVMLDGTVRGWPVGAPVLLALFAVIASTGLSSQRASGGPLRRVSYSP